jgi:hypothetical protein
MHIVVDIVVMGIIENVIRIVNAVMIVSARVTCEFTI